MGYYVLTEDAAVKLRKLLGDAALVEVRADSVRAAPRQPVADPVQFVRVASTGKTAGRQPGKWQKYLADANTWEDGGDCWVETPTDTVTLAEGRYLARRYGVKAADGLPIFVAGDAAGGLSGVDVSPTPPLHVSTAGGVATVSIDAATTSLPGYVTTASQTFSGDKGTQGGWAAIDTVNFSGEVFASVGQGSGAANFWHVEEPPGTDEIPYGQAAVVGAIKGASDRGYLSVSAGGTCGIAGETDLGLSRAKYSVRDGSTWKHGIYSIRTVQGAGTDAGLRITQEFAGGILVRETADAGPSGTGSGAVDLGCCPGVTLPDTLTLTLPDTSTDTLTYNEGNSWIGETGAVMGCWDLGDSLKWYLQVGTDIVPAEGGGACDPFSQTFTIAGQTYEVTE